ncbi:MAG: PTS sugar transporter subunit IIB [Erysipelotrichaceae bacterium]
MIKILICCASGSGTSMMMKITAEKACKKAGVEAKVSHSPISIGKGSAKNYDMVMTTPNFLNSFETAKKAGVKVVGLLNPMSVDEIVKHLTDCGFVE